MSSFGGSTWAPTRAVTVRFRQWRDDRLSIDDLANRRDWNPASTG